MISKNFFYKLEEKYFYNKKFKKKILKKNHNYFLDKLILKLLFEGFDFSIKIKIGNTII